MDAVSAPFSTPSVSKFEKVRTIKALLLPGVSEVMLRVEEILNGYASSENPEHAS